MGGGVKFEYTYKERGCSKICMLERKGGVGHNIGKFVRVHYMDDPMVGITIPSNLAWH